MAGSRSRFHTAENNSDAENQVQDNGQAKVSDFFPIRRSRRKVAKECKKEALQELVQAVLAEQEDGLEVKKYPGKGRGIITTRPFARSEFVVEYAGDLVDSTLAKEREALYLKQRKVSSYNFYFTFKERRYCVDATAETGKLGRLINHSRHGNLKPKVIEANGVPKIILVANRFIDANTELSFDYGDRRKRAVAFHPWLAN